MNNKSLETLTWVLIYSGLLFICLGLFVQRSQPTLGWAIVAAGVVDAAVGVVLIVVRSRRPDDTPPP
jgi:uncharacterized membrane protein HdeD (DUF308 family)